jgi:hypothetical protein
MAVTDRQTDEEVKLKAVFFQKRDKNIKLFSRVTNHFHFISISI